MNEHDHNSFAAWRESGGKRWAMISVQYCIERMYQRIGENRPHQSGCVGDNDCTCRVQFLTKPKNGMLPPTWAAQSYEAIGDTPETALSLAQIDTNPAAPTFWVNGHLGAHIHAVPANLSRFVEIHLHLQSGIARIEVGDEIEKFTEVAQIRVDTIFDIMRMVDPLNGTRRSCRSDQSWWGGAEVIDEAQNGFEPRVKRIYVWLPPEGKADYNKIAKWAAVHDGADLPFILADETDFEAELKGRENAVL